MSGRIAIAGKIRKINCRSSLKHKRRPVTRWSMIFARLLQYDVALNSKSAYYLTEGKT
ncbi:hypothetical protein PTT_19830 [Pyrenophora teres f. teres 0-1]|uniref:Uncharacterized protein n=1 Tax=Pyrenophora teres f. teres (strain 0-1) TaxID=861557 RepID=E3S9T6_PYRTT|nr:hypothetical protein PTT_19830 [Pyrenophora teres f. teres 0-1]